jgi:hypothetical protein
MKACAHYQQAVANSDHTQVLAYGTAGPAVLVVLLQLSVDAVGAAKLAKHSKTRASSSFS